MKILAVDDDAELRGLIGFALRQSGFLVIEAPDGPSALEAFERERPDLVILDEPMSGLDPLGRREVRDLILALRDAGKSVFFSSHILQDVEMICDRVAILVKGRLRAIGRLDTLVSREVLWFEVAVSGTLPAQLPGDLVSSSGEEALIRVRTVEDLTRLLTSLQVSGGVVTSVWPRRENLEDLFLREVRREPQPAGRP